MAVAKHPKLVLTGTAPNIKLRLTDFAGAALLESPGVYATERAAQLAIRGVEDALLEAFPVPAPLADTNV